jgi:hypothetical protein
MKQETNQDTTPGIQNENNLNTPKRSQISRRKFVEMTAASAIGFTILPTRAWRKELYCSQR